MQSFGITTKFCADNVDLDWYDVVWAIEHGIFAWSNVREFALLKLDELNPLSFDIETKIASLHKNEASEIMDLARDAASVFPQKQEEHVQRRWLYLLLKWVYLNREAIEQPLSKVEEIYADFEYPEEIEDFVGFLPPKDGWRADVHSSEENLNRLYQKWKIYLDRGPPG
jgi:hypothetical protein